MEETKLEQTPQTPKLKRHFVVWVPLIAFGLMLLGEAYGLVMNIGLSMVLPELSDGVTFLMDTYFIFIGIDVLVLVYCLICERPVLRSFGYSGKPGLRGNNVKTALFGLLIGFVLNAICILFAWLHGDLAFSFSGFDVPYLLLALVLILIQSGAEELITRGYMLGALRERYNIWVAILVNSFFFGALHLMNTGITVLSFINIVLVGLMCSFFVVYLDSLWMAIAYHTMWNFTQNIIFGLPNSGIVSAQSILKLEAMSDSPFYDATFGVEGTFTAAAVLVIVCVVLPLLGRRKPETV